MEKAKKGNKYLFKTNQKGKEYTYYIRRTTINGKYRTITAKTFADWKLKVADEITKANEKVTALDYQNITVKEASKLYLTDAENDAPSTYLRKEQYMRNYIIPELGSMKVSEIRNSHVRSFYRKVEQSKNSFNLVVECSKVINTFIQFCIDEEIAIEESPIKDGLINSLTKKKKRIAREKGESIEDIKIDREQISYILKDVQGTKEEIIYHLQILHGLRIGEALAVKFEDIDFDNNLININKQITSINKKRTKGTRHESDDYNVLSPTKTQSSVRSIPLVPPTRELLKDLIAKNGKSKGYVYLTRNKKACGRDNWNNRHHNPLMDSLGIYVPTHTLRKFFGSFHISSGTPIQVVSKWLGHSDIGTTLKHYAKVIKQDEHDNKWKTAELLGY
jgi:integrase|tara:strand:- start:1130 stop:2302 length:1173 start_codon:yes stop_codon:yes gene_type:complete